MSPSFKEDAPLIGARIGPYRIVRKLGAGGMGAVYLAQREDDVLHMEVVFKFLHDHLNTPDLLARFRREQQLMADLNHPHIATLLDAGLTEKGTPYIIMEHIEGRHFDVWVQETQPNLSLLLETFLKVVEALGSAHEQGIIHRDIKPQNILVTPKNIPKLLDFGIAHLAEPNDGLPRDALFDAAMTPAYAAPEQLLARPISPATDVYALGLVLLQLLTGRPPHLLGCSPSEAVDHLLQGGLLQEGPSGALGGRTLPDADSADCVSEDTLDAPRAAAVPATKARAKTLPSQPVQAIPEALGYVLRRCLAEWDHARFTNGVNLATAIRRLKANLFHETGPGPDPHKYLDAVFWFHERDEAEVRRIADQLAFDHGLRLWPNPSDDDRRRLSNENWETAVTDARSCVVCLGARDHIPWLLDPARRDTIAFYAQQLNVVPLLLPDAEFPEKQSALPGFLRGRRWLRAEPPLLTDLAAAIRGLATTEAEVPRPTGLCPYRGLEAFREEDRLLFFGREAYSQAVLEHVIAHRFSAVCGPSGSGKSSLVQAGVVPYLREQRIAVVAMTPTETPFAALAYALQTLVQAAGGEESASQLERRLRASPEALYYILREWRLGSGQHRVCLVIDQFEEFFTLAPEEETEAFADALCHALDEGGDHFHVLLTMRADFLGKCAVHAGLNNYIVEHLIQIMPMSREGLARAITEPARLAGLRLEAGLLDRLLDDLTGAAGELPLLEHALLELYERNEGGLLTRAAYDAVGGIAGALAGRAEQEYAALSADARQGLRKMFTLCLVQPGEDTRDTRRRATETELLAVGGPQANDLLAHWIAARLLSGSHDPVRGESLVDVAHEALIRNWVRIGEWMAEDRETARRMNRLRRLAAEWDDAGRDEGHLLRGVPLEQAIHIQDTHPEVLGPVESAFVTRSQHIRDLTQQWKRLLVLSVGGLGLVSSLLAAFAFRLYFASIEANREIIAAIELAEDEKDRAEQQSLAGNYNLALALNEKAGIALDEGKSHEAWLLTLAALSQELPSDKTLPEPVGRFADPRMAAKNQLLWTSPVAPPQSFLAVSEDGRLAALADRQGLIRLMDMRTGRQQACLAQAPQGVTALVLSPDGTWLAAASPQRGIYLWHLPSGRFYRTDQGHPGKVRALAFSGKPHRLASADADGNLVVRDPRGDRVTAHWQGLNPINHLVFLGDHLFAATRNTVLFNAAVSQDGAAQPMVLEHVDTVAITGLARFQNNQVVSINEEGGLGFFGDDGTLIKKREPLGSAVTAAVERDSGVIAFAAEAGPFQLWDPRTDTVRAWPGEPVIRQPVFTPEGLSGLDALGRFQRFSLLGDIGVDAMGGGDGLWHVAYAPDGTKLATAGLDGTVVVHSFADGIPSSKSLRGHQGIVYGVAFSPDGTLLASASRDGTVRLWDPHGPVHQAQRGVLRGHESSVFTVAFSPDGRRLVSGSGDQTLRIWDPTAPAEQAQSGVMRGHTGSIYSVAWSPDGSQLASASADKTVRLWNPDKPADQAGEGVLRGHSGRIWAVAYAPDGRRLGSASADKTLRLWDPTASPEAAARGVLSGHTGNVSELAFSKDGRLLVSASADWTLRLWDPHAPPDRAALGVMRGHVAGVWGLAFSPVSHRLATVSEDQTLRLWQPPEPAAKATHSILRAHTGSVNGVAFSPDGTRLASASQDQTVRLWHMDETGAHGSTALQGHTGSVLAVAFSPDGSLVASASRDKTLRLWDPNAPKGAAKRVLRGHNAAVTAVAFSPDGSLLASGAHDQTVRLWRPAAEDTSAEPVILRGHAGGIMGLTFSPDGRTLASGARDRSARLWDLNAVGSETPSRVLEGHAGSVIGVAFSPDGASFATGSHDATVRLWALGASPQANARLVLHGHRSGVYGVAFSPDGRVLASASMDHTVRLWDPVDGRPLAVLSGHTSSVNLTLAFNPQGTLLASPSTDQTIRLWHLDRLLFPPAEVPAHQWYGQLLDRSLYQMGYRLEGFKLIAQPHLRFQGVGTPLQPSALDHLDHPYQPGTDYVSWLLGEPVGPANPKP